MARHHNDGLRKLCGCQRRVWPKCSHPWHFAFKHAGVHHRYSLDRLLGRHIDSKSDAEKEADRLRVAIREGTFNAAKPVADASGEQTFEAYAREWLRTAALNLKSSTVTFYTDHLENHVFPLLGSRPVTSVRRADIRVLITTCREKKLSITTVAGIVRSLSTVLSQAVEDDLLEANPALRPGRYLRRGDEPESEPDPLSANEVVDLLAASQHSRAWAHPFVMCGVRTGMRLSELLALQWGDVDWRGGFIQVRRSLPKGKLSTPKNHQQRRVDLSRQLRMALYLWLRQQRVEWMKHGLPRPEWIFASAVGTPLDESNVRDAFYLILDKAGLHRRGPGQMRHTFASLLLMAGEPVTYVSRQMGHSSPAVTFRFYARWIPDTSDRKGVDSLDTSAPVAKSLQTAGRGRIRRVA